LAHDNDPLDRGVWLTDAFSGNSKVFEKHQQFDSFTPNFMFSDDKN
jgi:hypothetical protein